ncbi:type VI secretion system tube protein TssD, partial [Xanthovirga aplysinae]|uniref:type VI secretion system tube protein TssD n=1 Tax=Xanthovirga aplysinae TaxID=2529853 RepID=UPI001CA40A64
LLIESTGNTDFWQWTVSHNQTKDGSIIFYRRDSLGKLQELKFEKAYCIKFTEHFNANNTTPLQIEITLAAKKLNLNEVKFENRWGSE